MIVSPVFLQWVYRNPALLVGRLLQQDRSVHPRKHIAAMLSIIDNTLDNQPSPHQIKIYVLNIYPFFRDKHPSAHKSHPLFAQNPCVSQYHPIARNNPLFICNNHPSVRNIARLLALLTPPVQGDRGAAGGEGGAGHGRAPQQPPLLPAVGPPRGQVIPSSHWSADRNTHL